MLVVGMLLCISQEAYAQIRISEIAWMGSTVSASDEWIELFNTGGSAIDVDGFTLTDTNTLSITLSGTIAAGSRVVLERTDDNSAPGTAFLIYTGALTNSGTTLTLRDAGGAIEDQVVGGDNWENIGGDNTKKDTPQLSGSSFITAAPTPGDPPPGVSDDTEEDEEEVPEAEVEEENEEDNTQQASQGTGDGEDVSLQERDTEMSVVATIPSHGYVGQPVRFKAHVEGVGKGVAQSVTYTWNYGNGLLGTGREVIHTYGYPGTYILSVAGRFGERLAVLEKEFVVRSVPLSLSTSNGVLMIKNEADYMVDISRMQIQGPAGTFTFPPRSFVSASGELQLSSETLGFFPHTGIVLRDREGSLLAGGNGQASFVQHTFSPPPSPVATVSSQHTSQSAANVEEAVPEDKEASFSPPKTHAAATFEAVSPWTRERIAYGILFGVMALSILGLYARRLV